MSQDTTSIELFDEGTPMDLMLRGFGREAVRERTGEDIGYNGRMLREAASGIDRLAYKVEHVRVRVDLVVVEQMLRAYAAGELDGEQALGVLGLANPTLVKLKTLFAALGKDWSERFAAADSARRRATMAAGMVAKHGVDNPFKLERFQQAAGDTRQERYGARYTLAEGSSLAPAALEKVARARHGGLRQQGCAADLVARGFGRQEVIDRTGVDPGPRNSWLLGELRGTDRCAYKLEHVRRRIGRARALELAGEFERGEIDRVGVYEGLGLSPTIPRTALKLSQVYAHLDLSQQWAAAQTAVRERSKAKAAQTNTQRYGGVSPMASPVVRQKIRDTTRAHYGVENPSQSSEVKQRKRETSLRNFGVDSPMQSAQVRQKSLVTVRRRYAVDNVSQAEEVKQAKRRTTLDRYGVDHVLKVPQVRQAQMDTLRSRVVDLPADARGPFASAQVRARAADTHRARHGVGNPFELEENQAKSRATLLHNYGVPNASLSAQIRQRRHQTFVERYGVDNPFQAESVKERAAAMRMARYGVAHSGQIPGMAERVRRSKLERGTFSTSAPEQALHALLVEHFGIEDVLVQHHDADRYPFACDFYVPSRDMFIELNGSWTHGSHWYEPGRDMDEAMVRAWRAKGTAYYDNAVEVFTVRDVAKRTAAREHGLNYVVFWDGTAALADARLWLALGAPDGHDHEREHSWLPDRPVIEAAPWPDVLGEGSRAATAVARAATGQVRLSGELALWEADEVHRTRWGRFRARLLANRLRYLGKAPAELSDVEILRGMAIAGEVRAFSTFDNTGLRQVLDEHRPNRVYDPCAGWGERLATCAARGIGYVGTDVSPEVVAGHERIVRRYGLTDQSTQLGDAAARDMRGGDHEMVFTCPPYGSTEMYTEHGAENLDEAGFLAWWAQVLEHAVAPATQVFALQVNQAWKERMGQVVAAAGFELAREIDVNRGRGSHLRGRRAGGEYEQVLVFVRDTGR